MKKLMLATLLILYSGHAMAISDCGGRTSDGSFVLIHINTTGARGNANQGEVVIERSGNRFGYRFQQSEIAQYFEFDGGSSADSVVGVTAYIANDNPLSVKYVGPNFVDMDLKSVIDSGGTDTLTGNVLRVWKGPGHNATDQYQITKPACSVWTNI